MQPGAIRVEKRSCLALLLVLLLSTPVVGEVEPAMPAGESDAATRTETEQLKDDLRTVVATNPPLVGVTTTNSQKTVEWQATWRGWDGLHLELQQRTRFHNPTNVWGGVLYGTNAAVQIHLEQVQMALNIGTRIEVDGAVFRTTGDLTGFNNEAELRRAFLNLDGACILVVPVSYLVQVGYIPNSFYINKAYVFFPDIAYIGSLQIGEFGPPMGLDLITSSRDITFMEPAAPLQAFGPPNLTGIQIGGPVWNRRATWALGVFGDASAGSQYGNSSKNYGTAIGRMTWLAIDHLDEDHPFSNHYLHLGLSANYQYSATSNARFQSRPESHIAPYVIDTGNIDASGATILGAETAWVKGPICVMGEYMHSFVEQNGAATLNFGGIYAQASCYLTGESRPYNPSAGEFKRLHPRRDFDLRKPGHLGALEIAARISHTDLTDGNVSGGRLTILMGGVNWYLNPHIRWMCNGGTGHVSGGPSEGNLFLVETRIGVDF